MSQPMSGKAKTSSRDVIIGVIAVLAVVVALVIIYRVAHPGQVYSVHLPPGAAANGKMQWLQDQKKGTAAASPAGETGGTDPRSRLIGR